MHSVVPRVALIATLATITVATFIINTVLLVAVIIGRRQPLTRTFSMTLTASLVTADMLIAVTVMPLSVYDVTVGLWELGDVVCRLFTGADVTLCTASILHLTGLAADRYLAVCRPFFHRRLGLGAAKVTCLLLWLSSALVAVMVQMEPWRINNLENSSELELQQHYQMDSSCAPGSSLLYLCISFLLSFVLPLGFIIGFHLAILAALRASVNPSSRQESSPPAFVNTPTSSAKLQVQRRGFHLAFPKIFRSSAKPPENRSCVTESTDECVCACGGTNVHSSENKENGGTEVTSPDGVIIDDAKEMTSLVTLETTRTCNVSQGEITTENNPHKQPRSPRKKISSMKIFHAKCKSDRALKTVLCLVLCFVVCWCPFFFVSFVKGLGHHGVPYAVTVFVVWLGYVNSIINPFLYYRFNKTIRIAVRRLFKAKHHSTPSHDER